MLFARLLRRLQTRDPGAAFFLPQPRIGAELVRVVLTLAAAGGVVLLHGFAPPPLPPWLIVLGQLLLIGAYYADVAMRQRQGREPIPGERFDWIDSLILVALGTGLVGGAILDLLPLGADPAHSPWIIAEIAIVWLALTELWRLNVALSRSLQRPGVLMPLSFIFLIIVGTVLIKAPVATPEGVHLTWLDALFTMTSAVCVTGLVVRDTATDFTPMGQAIIGIFIQLGGLGFIVFGSMVAMMLGQAVPLRGSRDLSQMLQDQPVDRLRSFTRFIVVATILIELIAAAMMFPLWSAAGGSPGEELTVLRRAGLSLFHSVSAFCNAGFDITGASMEPYRRSFLAHGIIAPLIVLGGLGFPVLRNLIDAGRQRLRGRSGREGRVRLTLHTRLVLITTLALYIGGVAALGGAQILPRYYRTAETVAREIDSPLTAGQAAGILADASFMSITARTAGFNTVPMEETEPAGRFAMITLMIVGGSPGGAAGGLKTTVLAVLVLSVVATLRQRRETEVFGRSIADSLVRQAGTLALCYLLLIMTATFLLSLSEGYTFSVVFFEAVSAATTTGLSLGITPELTPFGRVVIIFTMFLGRVGPLALFAVLVFKRRTARPYAYPHEQVALG